MAVMDAPDRTQDRTHGLGPTRARVLALLQDAGEPLTAVAVATRLGVHANSARFHLDGLEEAGLVVRHREERSSPGRPKVLYAATPSSPDVADRRYRLLSEMLGEMLHQHLAEPGALAEKVGRSWAGDVPLRRERTPAAGADADTGARPGHSDEADELATLVGTLGVIGFDSHVVDDADGLRVEIGHCPFLEVAEKHSDVVCPVHLGLMRGVLERTGSSVDVVDLQPFVEPGLCRAHLTR